MSASLAPKHIPLSTKLAYGFGSVAFGVKDNGFSYFLLIYYNQVLGLSPASASLVLMLALIADAVLDPVIGYVSDNWRSRLGRRHPFMYAAILPVTAVYILVWIPPAGLQGDGLFWYMLGCTILVRSFITFYEIPSSALISELSSDYNQRTSLLSYRYFFGWMGGLTVGFVSLMLFFRPTEAQPVGVLNQEGYISYGLLAVGLMFVSMLVSSLGTHRYIPQMSKPVKRRISLRQAFSEVYVTLADRTFAPLFIASILLFLIVGLTSALFYYMSTFFWGLTSEQTAMYPLANFFSAFAALYLAPRLSKHVSKKRAALSFMAFAILFAPLPVVLRLVGLFPDNGDPLLLPLLIGHSVIEVAVGICVGVLISSMIADVVEASELRTGRRSEGVLFGARLFSQKAMSGVGVLLAGLVLEAVRFPAAGSEPASAETLMALALSVILVVWTAYGAAIFCVSRFKLDRAEHEANLAAIARARS